MKIKTETPKTTLVLGATPNPARYAYLAVETLQQYGHPAIPVGRRKGTIDGTEIRVYPVDIQEEVHTITLYLGARHQDEYYEFIYSLRPKRIIFNPGTENPEFFHEAREKGIEVLQACTLVMLATGQY